MSVTERGTEMRSYYGRPIVKEPTWTWEIPCYLFAGGLGGSSSLLSLAARVAGNEKLARTSLYIGAAADAMSPPLLIRILGAVPLFRRIPARLVGLGFRREHVRVDR